MSPQQTRVMQDTWTTIVPMADQAARMFYERLFETAPDLRHHFDDTDMPGQRRKLVQALAAVVDRLDCMDEIVPELENLGRRHSGYGVRDEHYETVGAALLWTLGQGLGARWTSEVEAAWSSGVAAITGVMKSAAHDDQPILPGAARSAWTTQTTSADNKEI